MIKIKVNNGETNNSNNKGNKVKSKLLAVNNLSLNGPPFITIDCDGRLLTPIVSVNELGKQMLNAAFEGNIEETKSLLCRGALFTTDWLGRSPLHVAARHNHAAVCDILLKAGISRDARTKVDKTALHLAAAAGHLAVVSLLLDYGCDPDSRDMLGMTPLHWAVQNCHCDVAKMLIKHFAQTDAVNKFDLSPVDIATQLNRPDLIEIINMDIGEIMFDQQNSEDSNNQNFHIRIEENNDSSNFEEMQNNSCDSSDIPLETILLEESGPLLVPQEDFCEENSRIQSENGCNFSASMKLLQQHGITMLQNEEDEPEDQHILSAAMESGHSVVLTDVGKEILNSVQREQDESDSRLFTLNMENSVSRSDDDEVGDVKNILKQINGRVIKKNNVKRNNGVVAKQQCKVISVSKGSVYKLSKSPTDMETVMKELIDARKTIEEYKVKLHKKEQEVERYKQQLKLLMDAS